MPSGWCDVGAHDDADGLSQLHHAGVYQTHQHDRHGGGGLDGNGDRCAQQQTLMGVEVMQLEEALQPSAGHFFQTLGHDGHSVEEKGQSAAEGEEREDVLDRGSFLPTASVGGHI